MTPETRTHQYRTHLRWTGNLGAGTRDYRGYSRDHEITVDNKPVLPASSDPAFRGNSTRYNPEELLLASLSACHMLWYLHLCSAAGVVVTDYSDQARGTMVEEADGAGRFTEAVLCPSVTVSPDSDRDLAGELHQEAHRLCFIANSVNFKVECRPTVTLQKA